mgnify:CR=1 FL=1
MELFVDAGELVVFEATADRLKAGCDIGNCSVEGLFKEIEVKSVRIPTLLIPSRNLLNFLS